MFKKKLYFLGSGHGCHRTRQFWPCAMICVFLVRWFSFSRVVKVNYMVKSPCMFCNSKPAVESLCFLTIFTRERYFNNIKKICFIFGVFLCKNVSIWSNPRFSVPLWNGSRPRIADLGRLRLWRQTVALSRLPVLALVQLMCWLKKVIKEYILEDVFCIRFRCIHDLLDCPRSRDKHLQPELFLIARDAT